MNEDAADIWIMWLDYRKSCEVGKHSLYDAYSWKFWWFFVAWS